jgi:hypothetical protein
MKEPMTGETKSLHGDDHCSDCLNLFEIVAVDLSIFRRSWLLFVCPNCGTMKAEDTAKGGRIFRNRAATLLAGFTRLRGRSRFRNAYNCSRKQRIGHAEPRP